MATDLYAELCDTLMEIILDGYFVPVNILYYVRRNLSRRDLHSANNKTVLSQEAIEDKLGEWEGFNNCPSGSVIAAILADYPVVSFIAEDMDTLVLNLDRPSETQLLTLAMETSPDEMTIENEQDGKLLVRMWWD